MILSKLALRRFHGKTIERWSMQKQNNSLIIMMDGCLTAAKSLFCGSRQTWFTMIFQIKKAINFARRFLLTQLTSRKESSITSWISLVSVGEKYMCPKEAWNALKSRCIRWTRWSAKRPSKSHLLLNRETTCCIRAGRKHGLKCLINWYGLPHVPTSMIVTLGNRSSKKDSRLHSKSTVTKLWITR